ncbi:hypothetical protein V6N13_077110 [Hibiscus sabdariffa]
MAVLKLLSDGSIGTKGGSLLGHISKLLNRDWDVSFKHIFGEVNSVPDAMAKLDSRNMDGSEVFLNPLSAVRDVLRNDFNRGEPYVNSAFPTVQQELPMSGVG